MNREVALDQIQVVIGKVLDRDDVRLSPDTRLLEDLSVDSTGIIEILMELEETADFEVDVDTLDPGTFATAGTLADYLVTMTEA
jgi:acyl carrier protein